jgi:hypothetical protein
MSVLNKHSESIASNTKSPTGGIFNQNKCKQNKTKQSETAKLVGGTTKGQKTDNL